MANLQEYNGRFCESEYEYAFITLLEKEGWQYLQGNKRLLNILCKPPKWYRIKISFWRFRLCQGTKTARK